MLTTAWRFRRFLLPYWLPLTLGSLVVIGEILADLAQPWPLKFIVDGAIGGKSQHDWLGQLVVGPDPNPSAILLRALIALATLVALSAACDFASGWLMNSAGQRLMLDIRLALFSHVQRLSLTYHDQQRVGDLVSRVMTDIDRIQDMLVAAFDTLIPNSFMLGGLAIVMVLIDPGFGLLALLIAPLLFIVTYRYTRGIQQASRRVREAESSVAAVASETLAAIRTVQAYGREEHEDRRFALLNGESLGAGLITIKLKAAFTPVVDLVLLVGTILVTYLGVHRVLNGAMTLGLLLVFLAYVKSLYKPMRSLSKLAYLVSRGTVSAERVGEVLEAQQFLPERVDARVVSRLTGIVELRDVSFRYQADRPFVLRDLSLRIESGEKIGIIGPTGAGKSTLVGLMMRFYDPERGMVLLDGMDVRDLKIASVRRQVSLLLQEPILFQGSILDNIRYGDPDAPIERVREVADAANVTEFLDRLPEGILTQVSERGGNLSGGQRQRVAIARAMLRDAPILILDEPTTGLDGHAEQLVLEGLRRLSNGKTTIVISHANAPLVGVNRVLRIENGAVSEVGSGVPTRSSWSTERSLDPTSPILARLAREPSGAESIHATGRSAVGRNAESP